MAERRRSGTDAGAGAPDATADAIDTRHLESLLGYNARRAALAVVALFLERMAPFGLRPVEYSVLSVIAHNPGVTARQVAAALDLLPPNLVGMMADFDRRGLIERQPHPHDGRAFGLHLTTAGRRLMRQAERAVTALEAEAAAGLSPAELRTLIGLLRRVWARPAATQPAGVQGPCVDAVVTGASRRGVSPPPPARSAPAARRARPRTAR